mgnify:CR=1 FL=1
MSYYSGPDSSVLGVSGLVFNLMYMDCIDKCIMSWSPEIQEYFWGWFDSAIASGLSDIEAREYALGMTEGGLRLMV